MRSNQSYTNDAGQDLRVIRQMMLKVSLIAQEGHLPSSLSILDLVYVFYRDNLAKYRLGNFDESLMDTFVLSKGHACLALYATLNNFNLISNEELLSFCKFDSRLGGHPDRLKLPMSKFSTGSLGHGLPLCVGSALGRKIKRKNNRLICLVGDGELNEGSNWEAIMLAAHHKLENLVCIVDNNDSSTRALDLGNLKRKFEAFDWLAIEINGHDHVEIEAALNAAKCGMPIVIIANTIKGYGIKSMEHNPEWHHKAPSQSEFERLIGEIK